MQYRFATSDDIELLVSERLKFIDVNENNGDYNSIKDNCYIYFSDAIKSDSCDVILAENDGKCVGTGIIFYYNSVPSAFNVTGKNAYITSMYVEPNYRRNGIGSTILSKLLEKAGSRGYEIIMLNASELGKPMYQKFGFADSKNGMILDRRK